MGNRAPRILDEGSRVCLANREAVRRALAPLGTMGHGIHGGEGAFYFWAKLPARMEGHDDAVIKWLVHRHGVCVIPGASCGAPGSSPVPLPLSFLPSTRVYTRRLR